MMQNQKLVEEMQFPNKQGIHQLLCTMFFTKFGKGNALSILQN